MNKNQGQGNGARDGRRARVENQLHARSARKLNALAAQLARGRGRRQEAFEGREVTQTTVDEMAGIYHAAAVQAYSACGKIINLRSLFARKKKGGVNPYPFRVRLAWIRALKQAGKLAVAECYQSAKIECEAATMADLEALEVHFSRQGGQDNLSVKAVALTWLEARGTTRDRGALPVSRRQVRHARECLITFWSLSGSQRWAWALRGDLALLAKCVRVARGEGFALWGVGEGDFHDCKARFAISRLLQRVGAGDILLTDRPDDSESALESWPKFRLISPVLVKA